MGIPTEVLLFISALGLITFFWDLFDRRSSALRKRSGFRKGTEIVKVKGSEEVPVGRLFDKDLKLSSKPDAILKEDGFLIPVDIIPNSTKIQDRHVIRSIVHLRLLETQEGKVSPYAVLRMGKKGRIVRIKNTKEKQVWLDSLMAEMRSISEGVPALATPSFKKCKKCEVNSICEFAHTPGNQS